MFLAYFGTGFSGFFFWHQRGVPDLDMNKLLFKDTLTQLSGVSFCTARGIVNISGSSFNNFFFYI